MFNFDDFDEELGFESQAYQDKLDFYAYDDGSVYFFPKTGVDTRLDIMAGVNDDDSPTPFEDM